MNWCYLLLVKQQPKKVPCGISGNHLSQDKCVFRIKWRQHSAGCNLYYSTDLHMQTKSSLRH